MKNITQKEFKIVQKNWIKASVEFDFKIITPYSFILNEVNYNIFAFLPQFGSENGMLIDLISEPLYITNNLLRKFAKNNYFYCSFINIDSFLVYDSNYFQELLNDWGRFK